MTTRTPEPPGQRTAVMEIATAKTIAHEVQSRRILPHAGGEQEHEDDEEERHQAPKVQSTRTLPHAGGEHDHEDDDEEERHQEQRENAKVDRD